MAGRPTRRSSRLEAKRQKREGGGDDPAEVQVAPEFQQGYKKLPREIWLHIFSFLPAQSLLLGVALVCREWRHCSRTQKKHLEAVKFVPTSVTAAKACRLIRSFPKLKIVQLQNWNTSADVILRTVASHIPGLAILDLNNVVIHNSQSLELVVQSCRSLKEVKLDGECSYKCRDTRHILDIFSVSLKLERFVVDMDYHDCDVLPLDKLTVRKWPKLTNVEFCFFPSTHGETFLKTVIQTIGGQLLRLRVGDISHEGHDPFFVLGQCHKLEELILDEAGDVMKTTPVEVIGNLPNLRRLELGFVSLSDMGKLERFFFLAEAATRLESLKLFHCSGLPDSCLSVIASRCLELTHVTLFYCSGFTNTGLYQLIAQCIKLKSVRVQWCREVWIDQSKVLELNPNVVLIAY